MGNPTGGAGNNVAAGINNRGQVTMNSFMLDGTIHAFVFTNGVPQDLGTYPSDEFATVVPRCDNINDLGQIVGFSFDSSFNQRALLWQTKDQAPVDLNTIIPAWSPWFINSSGGINNSGEIAATATNLNTFEVHAVLLTPVRGQKLTPEIKPMRAIPVVLVGDSPFIPDTSDTSSILQPTGSASEGSTSSGIRRRAARRRRSLDWPAQC